MSNLIIVESPTKARTLTRFLGKDYRIEATMGHIRDLPKKELGIEIITKNLEPKTKNKEEKINNYDFIPEYEVISGKKTKIKELKDAAKTAEKIILATDPDREGEAIAYHVSEVLGNKKQKQPTTFQRIVFHEITQSAIEDAIKNPREVDMNLVNAQQARRVLDRFVGYKLSPLLWNKLGMRWLSAGRVQTVAVRLIVEREREIRAFKPEEFWIIDVEVEPVIARRNDEAIPLELSAGKAEIAASRPDVGTRNDKSSESFFARLFEVGGEKAEIKNKEQADKIVADLKTASYKVANIETKEGRRYPSAPFTTSTLQQTASNRLGWSAKRTMQAAQRLYEEGLITYHRTDSTNLAVEAVSKVRDFISQVFGQNYLPDGAKFYKTKSKVAQEAHEAIRPTEVKILGNYDLKKLSEANIKDNNLQIYNENLGRDGELLYSLIWKRFIACQMNEAVFDQTNVTIEAKRNVVTGSTGSEIIYILKASGEIMKFDGWMRLYGEKQKTENNNQEDKEKDKTLPQLSIDEKLQLNQILPQQKFTEPPPRYTEASLIKILEEKGIGRPSTYAPIITTIQDRKYVEKIEKKFHATDLGMAVVDFLVKYFPDIFEITFTAKMEDELDEVANGELTWKTLMNEFYQPFIGKLENTFKTAGRVKLDLGTTDEKCPQCGSPLAIRLSKYGKFLACTNFPKCKFTKNIVEKANIKCPQCGGEIIIRKTRRGKQFYGCSNYPKCVFAAWKKEDIK
ncbi:type I DNA topoisomerase [Candidatus Microgenomates bacterium]|nr:type I DNA topoisomerase [Candidatus Microgenomates bacterium]